MAKKNDESGKEPVPEPTFSKETVEKALSDERLIERYTAFHTMSVQRSIQFGDPKMYRDAADTILALVLNPPKPAEPGTPQDPRPTNEDSKKPEEQ